MYIKNYMDKRKEWITENPNCISLSKITQSAVEKQEESPGKQEQLANESDEEDFMQTLVMNNEFQVTKPVKVSKAEQKLELDNIEPDI